MAEDEIFITSGRSGILVTAHSEFCNVCGCWTASVVEWSKFLATDPEARVRFPALPEKKVVGLKRGLVSTTEELLDRKVAAPV
jgi:hypothetical protein